MSYDIRTRDNTDVPAPATMGDDTDDTAPAAMGDDTDESAPMQDGDPAVPPTVTEPIDPVDEHTPDPVAERPDNQVDQPDEMAAPEHAAEPIDTGEASDGEGHEVPDPPKPSAEHTPMFAAVATEETAATAQPQPVHERDLMPGDMAVQPVTALWPDDTVADLRTRWQAAQLRFVDDPAAVAADMQALVGEAVQALSTALTDRRRDLDAWNRTEGHDTEQLRIVVQRYRDFFNVVLGH